MNVADYEFPQKRKRVYIYAELTNQVRDLEQTVKSSGLFTEAFAITDTNKRVHELEIGIDPYEVSSLFGHGDKLLRSQEGGPCKNGRVFTAKVFADYEGLRQTLGDIVVPEYEVLEQFLIEPDKTSAWEYLKGGKKEKRGNKASGFEYTYSEGSMSFRDPLDRPPRTILTDEGGTDPSCFKHAVETESGRYRLLTPDEPNQTQGFSRRWAEVITDGHHTFVMGNVLVLSILHAIGKVIHRHHI